MAFEGVHKVALDQERRKMNRNWGGKDVLAREAGHGSGGMVPQKNFKIQGVAGTFWSGFGMN